MMIYLRISLLIAISLSSGCAVMNKEDCLRANWYDVGVQDGNAGHTLARLAARNQACGEHGIMANQQQYMAGRKAGLKHYCTDARGYNVGYYGHHYAGVCEGQAAKRFVAAYQQGRRVYLQRQKVIKIEKKIRHLEDKIKTANEIKIRQSANLLGESTPQQRYIWLQQLNEANQRLNDYHDEKRYLRHQLYKEKNQLDNLPEKRY